MSRITTDRPVKAGQLAAELGGVTLRVVGPEPDGTSSVDATGVGTDNLRAAIAAHVPGPDAPPPPVPPSTQEQLDALVGKLVEKGTITASDAGATRAPRPK